MKKVLRLDIFLFIAMAFMILVNNVHANEQANERKLFGYVGAKLGYNQQFLSKASVQLRDVENGDIAASGSNRPGMNVGLFAGMGYKITPSFAIRTELEYNYRIPTKLHFDINFLDLGGDGYWKTEMHTLFANLYFDHYIIPSVNLYMGGGIGVTFIDTESQLTTFVPTRFTDVGEKVKAKRTNFAWNVGIGVGYAVVKNVVLDLNVRYVDFGKVSYDARGADPQLDSKTRAHLSAVDVALSVSYRY